MGQHKSQINWQYLEKRREFIVDRDESVYDSNDEYSDDKEEDMKEVKLIDAGPNMKVTPGISVFLHAPAVPVGNDPERDPQLMYSISLSKEYCLDDDGNQRLKISDLKPWQPLPPGLKNKRDAEAAKKKI